MITEDGHSKVDVGRQIQAGANTRRKVEEVMLDRNIIEKAEMESPESVCYMRQWH